MAIKQLDLFGDIVIPSVEPSTSTVELDSNESNINETESISTKIYTEVTATGELLIKKDTRGRKSNKEIFGGVDQMGIPEDEVLRMKLYHPIRQVAKWFGVPSSQIRFWENQFEVLTPRKNKKGDRLFRFEDIQYLKTIYYLLRIKKYKLVF